MPSPTKLPWKLSYCIFKVFLLFLNNYFQHCFLFQLKLFRFLKADVLGDIKHLAGRPFGAERELKIVYSDLLDYFSTTNNSQ